MLGSGVEEPVTVCDIAVPLWPHNNAVDRIATAEGATRLDDILMRRSPTEATRLFLLVKGQAGAVPPDFHRFPG